MKRATRGGTWRLENMLGILAEISEEKPSGAVSFASEIMAEAQDRNEPVAWVAGAGSIFYPPDLSLNGIDLSALAVIRAGGNSESLTAAEWLLRSGAFGLVIVDLPGPGEANHASLSRIQNLAERSASAVIFLTTKRDRDPSLGPGISLRAIVSRPWSGSLTVQIQTIRDKRSYSHPRQSRRYHGPPGMR